MVDPKAGRGLILKSLLLAAVFAAPFFSGSGTGSAATAESAARLNPVDSYRLSLLEMKGHLSVARSLLQNRAPGAGYHLEQAVQDVFAGARDELERRSAPLTADVLDQLKRATEVDPQAALATIDSAANAVDGSFAQTGGMDGGSALSLAEVLLRKAVQLFAEAVEDNEVVDLRKYQSGRGLVVQAEALVRHATGIKGRPGQDALVAAVVLIRQAWPGVTPPPIVYSPEDVVGRLEEAVATMDRMR